MKKVLIIIVIILISESCGQTQKINNLEKKTGNIMNNLRKFKYEPLFQIRIQTPYNYEVRVNDIVVIRRFNDFANNNVININQAIVESGEQQIDIRVFPRYISKEEHKEYLEKELPFQVSIEETSWLKGSLVTPKIIFEYEMPLLDNTNKEIDFTQMKFFKANTVFNAEIPYSLVGWQDSKVFELKDAKEITPRILAFYKKIKEYYENQQGEKYISTLEKGFFNLYQANYYDSETAKERDSKMIKNINKKPRLMGEIKNYKLEIMGNGRLLGLTRTDGFNKGEGVLRTYYNKNAFRKVNIDEILLHMPKGSDEFEVIWYMGYIKPVPIDEE